MPPISLPTDLLVIERIRERFVAKLVETDNGCLEWNGYRDKDGYGRFRIGKSVERANKVALWLKTGEWLESGWEVCHTCDNPPCCNPEHLFKGTKSDNMKDMADKGRKRGGRAGTGSGTGTSNSTNRAMDELIERIMSREDS